MHELNSKIGKAEEEINKQKNRLWPCFKGVRKSRATENNKGKVNVVD